MSTGPIQRLERNRVEDRHDVRLPAAWVRAADTPAAPFRGRWLSSHDAGETQGGRTQAPVLVMLADPAGPALRALLDHGRAGARVYVLAPVGWEPKGSDISGCPTVLVRRVAEVPVSGWHTDAGAQIWMGAQAGGDAPWRLRLAPEQAASFRQLFLRLFWHEAVDEAFSGGNRLVFRAAGGRPFDVPNLSDGAPVRLVAAATQSSQLPKGARVHCSTAVPPNGQPSHLWLPPGSDHHDALGRLVAGGTRVQWWDRSLPDLTLTDGTGNVLLPGSKYRLRVELTREQAADGVALLEQQGLWAFQTGVRLGDQAHSGVELWLEGAANANAVEHEQSIAMPDVGAESLRAIASTTPGSWPTPQPLALSARYTWTVVPPSVPAGASEDPLVGSWKKADADWHKRLASVRSALELAEGNRGRIGRSFARLVSAMMGFERTQSGLLAESSTLEALLPSEAGPAGAPALLSRLERLEEQTKTLQANLEESEQKAREDEEREKQEAEWRRRVEQARRALPEHRAEVSDANEKRPALVEQIEQLSEEIKTAGKKAQRSLKAERGKLQDQLTRLDRQIQRLTGEIEVLERTAAEPFAFKPPARPATRSTGSAGRFVPTSSGPRAAAVVPSEALPEVGKLRSHKGKRYLVIERWEDLDLGEQAAERLHAHLVAPENT